ncbi:GAF domain-containing protein [Marinigracilibium pacificum]|uniref:GAF domain-containing protein n=1 Tax=Marinigracilibium pacificum TaxID=2729599 RepID=A0A848IXM5_9BACT|nr:GAF domain-containing protein [Marinigracilibium pacificum]NMM48396.1 GAF domain-containing protein [Marinigracilibium pacificum]
MKLQDILKWGINPDQPRFLKRKVYQANITGLILTFFVSLPFTLISTRSLMPIIKLPIAGIFLSVLSVLLNRFGMIYISRIIISLVPITLSSVVGAYIVEAGNPPMTGLSMLSLAFLFIPFIVFDIREKGYLFACAGICIAMILGFDFLNSIFEIDLDRTELAKGNLTRIAVLISVVFAVGIILTLLIENRHSEEISLKYINESKEIAKKMEESEHKAKENLKEIEAVRQNEKRQQWAVQGLAEVTELLRGHYGLRDLCDKIIAFVVDYMQANQGTMYLLEAGDTEKDSVLNLYATYAYNRKKFEEGKITPGQGLVGQAFIEKEVIHLKEIPQNYVKITSGLGEATPNSIIIVPMIFNEQVEGIIEIASFNEFDEYQIEFVKKLGESIASSLKDIKINESNKELLEQARQQEEEMKAQEEEMRQNMEELAATQEEMIRKEKLYLKQIEDLQNKLELVK